MSRLSPAARNRLADGNRGGGNKGHDEMTNRLSDLNSHLFNQLERLSGDLSAEEIEREVARTEAIVQVADQITDNAKTMLQAAKLYAEHGQHVLPMLPQIGAPAKSEDAA